MVSLPLIDAVGFAPVYAACATVPLAAWVALPAGVRHETGTFLPGRGAGDGVAADEAGETDEADEAGETDETDEAGETDETDEAGEADEAE